VIKPEASHAIIAQGGILLHSAFMRVKGCYCDHYSVPSLSVDHSYRKPSTVVAISSEISRHGGVAEEDEKQLKATSKSFFCQLGTFAGTCFASGTSEGLIVNPVHVDTVQSNLLQRIWKSEQGGPSTIVGSGTALDNLRFLPIEPTKRNAELLYCCKSL
jgi:hypothetical protein